MIRALLIFILLFVSMEVMTMATIKMDGGGAYTAKTAPKKTPVWLQGGNVGGGMTKKKSRFDKLDELQGTMGLGGGSITPNFNTPSNVIGRRPDYQRDDVYLNPNRPAPGGPTWLQSIASAIGAANTGGGNWMSPLSPQPAYLNPPITPLRDRDREPVQRDDVYTPPPMPVYEPSQTHPPGGFPLYLQQLLNQQGAGAGGGGGYGFANTYGGNWRGGGGGGGYGGGGSYPDWMRNFLKLNNWNI